jgi:ABC-type bacteriocin/lantibiotic exporter with double-glycine peptidase domain
MHRGGWWSLISADESKGKATIDRKLLLRVSGYARPYWGYITLVLISIIVISLLELIPPLLFRNLIDEVIPNKDFRRLTILAIAMIALPVLSGLALKMRLPVLYLTL